MNSDFLRPAAVAGSLCLAIILISITTPVAATSYIGLYTDDTHSECSWYVVPFEPVTFWIWVQPGTDGITCVDFTITIPENVIQAAATVNPEAGYQIGDAIVPPGSTVCFPTCRTEWVWTHKLQCVVTDILPSIITLDPHGDYGIMRETSCTDSEDPVGPMTKINDLFLNQGCCLPTQASSWGAIKSLMQ